MDYALKAQLRQVIAIAVSSSSADVYGQTVVVSAATCFARVEPRYREIPAAGGILRTTHMLVLDENAPALDLNSSVWLPGDASSDTTLARRPKQVHPCYDENGALDHYEVLV